MECQHRACACPDAALRVIYFDLVYQWRQIADELEAIEWQQGARRQIAMTEYAETLEPKVSRRCRLKGFCFPNIRFLRIWLLSVL
jgi:hypothetical protein